MTIEAGIISTSGFRNFVLKMSWRYHSEVIIQSIIHTQGYRDRQAYIATQLPLTSTVADLWRLLCDHECKCIIALEYSDPDDEVRFN